MPPLTPRRLRVILAVSIALNLFLAAFVGAQRWKAVRLERLALPAAGFLEGEGMRDPEGAVQRLGTTLPRADAALLRRAVLTRLDALAEARRGFAAAVERTREEVARNPVDPTALRAAIEEARRQRQRFGPLVEEILLDIVPRMSPEGRQVLARYRGGALP